MSTSGPDAAPDREVVLTPVEPLKLEDPQQKLDALFAPFAAVMWAIFLLIYIYVSALAVALMSFSYKALKGYDAYEPVPQE